MEGPPKEPCTLSLYRRQLAVNASDGGGGGTLTVGELTAPEMAGVATVEMRSGEDWGGARGSKRAEADGAGDGLIPGATGTSTESVGSDNLFKSCR